MKEDLFKGSVAGVGAIWSYMADNYTPLMTLLVVFEVMDYVTGIYAAGRTKGGGIDSKTAINGFCKKVFYFFLVGVGFGMDFVVHTSTASLGINFAYPAIFGLFSIYYLLSTELISILENLAKIGVEIPLLTKALKVFRQQLESIDQLKGLNDEKLEEEKNDD